jgi:hypothetical protein
MKILKRDEGQETFHFMNFINKWLPYFLVFIDGTKGEDSYIKGLMRRCARK